MKKTTPIAMFICHFGTYPWYLPYFINSCKFNPTIDFYIITDNTNEISNKSDNIKIVYQTLDSFKELASEKLGFTITNFLGNNKIADFKPALGFLFSNIIASYTFWGYTDLDITFGNIRNFIIEDVLENYNVLSGRHDCIYGKFCLFKNEKQTNTLFLESRDYKSIFMRPQRFYFDSCNVVIEAENSILNFSDYIQSITYVVENALLNNKIKVFFDFLGLSGTAMIKNHIYWDNGILNYKNEFEIMYYEASHYYELSKNKNKNSIIPDNFVFDTKSLEMY